MTRPVLLDTCAAIWLMNGEPLSRRSRQVIDAAADANVGVYISPFSSWEIATLAGKGKVQLTLSPLAWFNALLAQPGVRLASMSPDVLIASASLPGSPPRDPADRIIAATGRTFGYVIVTRDSELIRYAAEGHIEVVVC